MSDAATRTPEAEKRERRMLWAGRALTVLAALPFLPSAIMKLAKNPRVVEGFEHFGYPESVIVPIGVLELVCLAVYLIPKSCVLGAILLTGYMGGAIATHVRIGEPVYLQVTIGVAIWAALFLRDSRLRALLPLRCAC